MVTSESAVQVPFDAHIGLLHLFLANRAPLVEKVQSLLNAQERPLAYRQDRQLLFARFEDAFFKLHALSADQVTLRGQLQQAHWASGFRPRDMAGMHNDLVNPGEMMVRAFGLWKQTRWPGRNGRVQYAQTLFDLYLLRNLEFLVLRIWDAGPQAANARMAQVQEVLDELWATVPADHVKLVRDARWLIPLAQSPTTDELFPYFDVAQKVAASLTEADRLEINKASVLMAGGHLRSQLRYYTMKGATISSKNVVLESRRSNALDLAMTIQALVPMLRAYEKAVHGQDQAARADMADAICQGISPDPELLVSRIGLIGPYTMIEHLFVSTDGTGRASLTPMGQQHLALLQEYEGLMRRLAPMLHQDCAAFRPIRGGYSPYGLMYGFSSNITEHMALKSMLPDAVTRYGIEDAFTGGEPGSDKLDWVSGWRKLPHVSQAQLDMYEYPQQFAEDIFDRIEAALRSGVSEAPLGRLLITRPADPAEATIPELPVHYLVSSDPQLVAAGKARFCEQSKILHDRQEGELAVSFATSGGWAGIGKDFLTEELGAGRDVKVSSLPVAAAAVLEKMCPGLVAAG